MAYKDEYQVARLSLDPRVDEIVAAEFGPGSRVKLGCIRRCCAHWACAPSCASDPGSGQRCTSCAR